MPRQEIPEGIVRKQRQPFHKQEEHDAGKGEKRYKGHARQQPPDRFFLQFSGHGVSVSSSGAVFRAACRREIVAAQEAPLLCQGAATLFF